MFVPSDGIYQAALAQDPALIEYGVQQQVLMATPTTLIGLLWAVHYGWRQELIAESAREIAESARELHSRLGRFVEPFAKVGRQLDSAVGAYNEAIGSFEHRVIPQVRKIEQAGAASEREVLRARRRSRSRARAITRGWARGRGSRSRRALRDAARDELAAAARADRRAAAEHVDDQRERDRHRRRQLVDDEEQQVEAEREQRRERRRAQLLASARPSTASRPPSTPAMNRSP